MSDCPEAALPAARCDPSADARVARLKTFERDRLIVDDLNRGVSVAEIAARVGVGDKRMRALVVTIARNTCRKTLKTLIQRPGSRRFDPRPDPTRFTQVDLVGRLLRHEVGKVARRAGWGAESRYDPTKAHDDSRAIRLGRKRWATPHPAP